jgi:hypothetical protein
VATLDGCNAVNRVPPGEPAAEQFTYAHQALEALCNVEPARALCDDEQESPRQAGPRPSTKPTASEASCSVGGSVPRSRSSFLLPWLVLALTAGTRRCQLSVPKRWK